jgi:hypothetical protein
VPGVGLAKPGAGHAEDRMRRGTTKRAIFWLYLLNDSGQGLMEYAFIILFVALVAYTALITLGRRINNNLYTPIVNAVNGN